MIGGGEKSGSEPAMHKSRRSTAAAGAVVLAALLAAVSSSFGQDGRPAGESNMWDQGVAQGWNPKNMSPEQRQRMARFLTFTSKGVPEQYLKASNDVGYTIQAIAAGGPLYVAQCKKCHGETGLGNGELAQDLNPSPALLAYLMQQPIAVDQYLLWTISEGGKQFNTAMPSFKSVLTQQQIWQIIAYLRAGFPAIEEHGTAQEGGAAPPVETDEPSPAPKSGE
jgi:mono/diheme cytochrome c family protein